MARVYYYEDDPVKTGESLARYHFALAYVRDKKVLDVGCGARRGPLILSEAARDVVGSDISSEAIAYCARRWPSPRVRYAVSDATALDFVDNVFDVVTSFEVLEHVKDQERLVAELRRVLKSDGVCVLSTPNTRVMSPGGVFTNPDHTKEFSVDELKIFLSRFFSRVELYGQSLSSRALEVLARQQQSYASLSRVPVFLKRLFPVSVKARLARAYSFFYLRKSAGARPQDIDESDFLIASGRVEEARYIIAVCRP